MRTSSDIEYLPLGRRSASTGTRAPMRVKSSSVSGTPASCAIASRCSTALVEPPSAMTTVMAFSNASRVRMSRGRMPRFDQVDDRRAGPLGSRAACLRETASCAELFGRLMPSASMAEAIVLAVYMPPQEPGPGMAVRSTSRSCRVGDRAARVRADRLEHRDDVAPLSRRAGWCRRRRTPPGGSSRAIAITQPGMFLSQPPMATRPSKPSAPTTVSIESAITSRDTSE